MINFNQPESIITGLLDNFNNLDILPDLKIQNIYTGNFQDLAENSGVFGVLPLAGTATGDILALTPLLDKNISEWPVMKFSHHGGDASFMATSLSLLPVFAILGEIRPRFICDDKDIIIKSKKNILALGKLLGEDHRTGQCIAYLEGLVDKHMCSIDEYTLYKETTAPCWFTDFLDTFRKIYVEDNSPVALWNDFLKQYPFVVPARQLLFGAESGKETDAFNNAWSTVTAEYYYNNFIFNLGKATSMGISGMDTVNSRNFTYLFEDDPRLEAARYIIRSGKGKDRPAYPAIGKEAEEEPSAELWLQAADLLLEKGILHEAYCAYLNAGYWFYLENEDFYKKAAAGALKAVTALKNPVMEYLIRAVLEE